MNFRLSIAVAGALCAFAQDHATWREYGGATDAAQYSALKQITRANVDKLEVAWTYPMGDGRKYFFNPIVVDEARVICNQLHLIGRSQRRHTRPTPEQLDQLTEYFRRRDQRSQIGILE